MSSKKATKASKKNVLENEDFSPPSDELSVSNNEKKSKQRRNKTPAVNIDALRQNLQIMHEILNFDDAFNEQLIKHNVGICRRKLQEMISVLN